MCRLLRKLSWRNLRQRFPGEGELADHDTDDEESQLEEVKGMLCDEIKTLTNRDVCNASEGSGMKRKAEGVKKDDNPKATGVKKKEKKDDKPKAVAKKKEGKPKAEGSKK